MNKKGFTLAELLGVIVLLSIIIIIVFPTLLKQIKGTQKAIDDDTLKIVISAAKDYSSKNNNITCVSVDTLIDEGLLSSNLDITANLTGAVKIENNNYTYEKSLECPN